MNSLYALLEVSQTSTDESIKDAFHRHKTDTLSDINAGTIDMASGVHRLNALVFAYNTLTNSDSRRQYDLKLRQKLIRTPPHSSGGIEVPGLIGYFKKAAFVLLPFIVIVYMVTPFIV